MEQQLYTERQLRLALSESFKASQGGYNITADEIINLLKPIPSTEQGLNLPKGVTGREAEDIYEDILNEAEARNSDLASVASHSVAANATPETQVEEDIWTAPVEETSVVLVLSKDNFISAAKSIFQEVLSEYKNSWGSRSKGEESSCSRCGGFTQIEQGGYSVDCPACDGTGEDRDTEFDPHHFSDAMHSLMFECENNLCELLDCKILEQSPEECDASEETSENRTSATKNPNKETVRDVVEEVAEKYADQLIEANSLQPHERTWFIECLKNFHLYKQSLKQ